VSTAALRYLPGVATLRLDRDACTGCRMCTIVCPHGVLAMDSGKRASIVDLDACMECGACVTNCAYGALSVNAGVGCASAIIHSCVFGGEPSCGCSDDEAGCGSEAAPDAPRPVPTRRC
jgi:NAD-dependent dihydropyrimidine dehydrogenase PreA subunit